MPAVVVSNPPGQNGIGRHFDNMSTSQIKAQMVEVVQRESKGAGALALIKAARHQVVAARDHESRGDLKNALASYTKGVSLVKTALDSTEYKREAHTGLVHKECAEFQRTYSADMTARMTAIEEKLKAMEKLDENKPVRVGGIQERIQALKNSGLNLATERRVAPTPSSPMSTTHTIVSPSSFGPPSPTSTPSSSPVQTYTPAIPIAPPLTPSRTLSISSTEAKFPSISELDETYPAPRDIPDYNFLPIDRPSSTPVTPTVSSPLIFLLQSLRYQRTEAFFQKDLQNYLRDFNVLLLDVRNRGDFDKAHIKVDAVVCVEPVVLTRPGLTAQGLEDSMVGAPTKETTMFKNRDKFDLVVLYDHSSTTLASQPMTTLFSLIYDQAFTKMLRNMPMLLVGGLDAWRREMGDDGIAGSPPLKPLSASVPSPPINGNGLLNGFTPSATNASQMTNGFSSTSGNTSSDPHQLWNPRARSDTNPPQPPTLQHRQNFSLDQSHSFGHSRAPAEISYPQSSSLTRRPAVTRASPSSLPQSIPENSSSMPPAIGSITYPSFAPRMTSSPSLPAASSLTFASSSNISPGPITSPPLASINPSLSRRRSDFIDQSMETLSLQRQSIDYPPSSMHNNIHVIRPPPAVASPAERQERATPRSLAHATGGDDGPPRINSDYPPSFWPIASMRTSGLKNLGNTCYMNAPIQCLTATFPFAQFFTMGRWRNAVNTVNPLGSKGLLSGSFASLIHAMWSGELPYIIPLDFRKVVCKLNEQYIGSNQHDSQEFLSFLLDGIHEDLNRLIVKPTFTRTPEQEAELERLSTQVASEQEWRLWKTRNDSIIVDFFQGQFKNRVQCLTCLTTSTTYNVFSILQLPIPHGRSSKVPLQSCLEAFFNTETLEKEDAWDCPKCKAKRRATKQLSLARLPPVLVIHLKRFEINGRFSDKVDTFVDYPVRSLDLTSYMPPPLPPGADKGRMIVAPDDPRSQVPPYRYDLYGVTNHTGNLSSGHYTAFIMDRDGWKSCDDSSIRPVDEKQVVNQKAYVLFYKRSKNVM
ncbi:Ubiquitin carboxyl-terminal hydrolase 4 [Mycena indigotica]|uniref:ubiquitinyl hydrolase 1 n=1 Tax=Mycena indigotica TaxID=2126181 RepID=A0A8H6T318_9AGAR|nr:Ubiquitin carboxyl-terminal hydrolase 4 [Mycena indigotica]KAF7309945.1 Ubiquitin carboxyl-terminal hydrolase 4 [Mycena indigotica]